MNITLALKGFAITMVLALVTLCHLTLTRVLAANYPPTLTEAKTFFKSYAAMKDTTNPKLAALYADSAQVAWLEHQGAKAPKAPKTTLRRWDGKSFKALLPKQLKVWDKEIHQGRFEDVTFTQEEQFIRIKAQKRLNFWDEPHLKLSLVVGKDAEGQLKIYQATEERFR